MSDILRKWLVEDVGLDVANFEQDFATGYVFGELLCRFGMLPDFDRFNPRGTPEAMINNYTRLQPSFEKLGIKFDSRTSKQLMREEPGVALSLLYSIKQNVGQLQKDLKKFQHTGKLGKELGAVTPATRGLLEAQQYNTLKEPFMNGNQRLFEESMRSIAGNNKEIMEAVALKRFGDHQHFLEMKADAGNAAERAMMDQQAMNFRSTVLTKMGSARNIKGKKLQHDDAIHAALLKRKEDTHREETRVEMTLTEKAHRKKLEEINHASLEALGGIDAFENNMRRLIKSPPGGDADDDDVLPTGAMLKTSRKGTIAATTGRLVEESESYMRGIKAQRNDDLATKKERAARRRMVLRKQQEQALMDEAHMQEDDLMVSLSRECAEEKRIGVRLLQLRQEKAVMIDDRAFRESQYEERRKRDMDGGLHREQDLHRSLCEQYTADAAAEANAWEDAQRARAADKAACNAEMCEGIALQLLIMAESAGLYRAETGSIVPLREYRRWLAMFRSGLPELDQLTPASAAAAAAAATEPLPESARGSESPVPPSALDSRPPPESAPGTTPTAVGSAEDGEGVDRVTKAIVDDYLDCLGYFAPIRAEAGGAVAPSATPVVDAHPIGFNGPLGRCVANLMEQLREKPETGDLPAISYSLRLAVIGAPFSGKTAAAQELAQQFKLKLLDPEVLINEAMEAAQAFTSAAAAEAALAAALLAPSPFPPSTPLTPMVGNEQAPPTAWAATPEAQEPAAATSEVGEAEVAGDAEAAEPAAPVEPAPPSRKAVLGMQIKAALCAGADIADDVMVHLMVLGMQEAGFLTPPPPAPDATPVAAGDLASEPSSAPEPDPSQGFVLDGFPRTLAQAQLMEHILTGLDLEEENRRCKAASRLAPPPPEALPDLLRPLHSALDAVIVLELSDETIALKRALGRRQDSDTDAMYHIEFYPPPSDQPGLVARLLDIQDPSNDAVQIQRRLTGYCAEAAALASWLKRFQRLHRPIDATRPLAEVHAAACECASSMLLAANSADGARTHATTAAKNRKSAEEAQEFTELARGYAEAAAKELLTAKRTELAAQALLLDPKSKNPDPGATEVLKAQAAAKCLEQLKACRIAAADTANYSERANFYAGLSSEALERAVSCLAEAELSLAAKKDAQEAAADAQTAQKAALLAASRADAAKEAADVAVQQAEKFSEVQSLAPDDNLALAPPAPDPAVDAAKVAEEAAKAAAGVAVPVPIPSSVASVLLKEWRDIEGGYMEGLGIGLASLAEEHGLTVMHFEEVRASFKTMLARPDERPAIATQFQMAFNAVEDDVRQLKETQGELLLRASELKEKLWGVCDRKLDEADAERSRVTADSYVADHTAMLVLYFSALLQVEMDRFAATINLGRGCLQSKYGVLTPPSPETDIAAPNMMSAEVPPDVKDKIDEKSKTVMTFPPAIAALQVKAASLATALKVAFAVAASVKTKLTPGADDGKKKASTPKPAKSKGEVPEVVVDPVIEEAIAMEMLELGSREVEILEARTVLLAERAAAAIQDVASTAERTSQQLVGWTRERYAAECSAVVALDEILKEAAHTGRPLEHDLLLQDDQLVLDRSQLHVAPASAQPPTLPREPMPPAALATTRQLGQLVSRLSSVAPAGYMKLSEAGELLCCASADGTLPRLWLGTTNVAMLSMLRQYDPILSGYVDWREIVCNLISASFPAVMGADGAVMAQQVTMLAAADSDSDGFVIESEWESVELWFQLQQFQPGVSDADLEGQYAIVDPEASKAHFDRAGALKKVLWNMFSSAAIPADPASDQATATVAEGGAAATGGSASAPASASSAADGANVHRMNFRAVLLYLCADRNLASALQKGCSVMSGSPSPKARVSAEQVVKMAHPLGTVDGADIHCAPISVAEVAEMVAAIHASWCGDAGVQPVPTVCAEELMYSSGGERAMKYMMPRYTWKDAFAATRFS